MRAKRYMLSATVLIMISTAAMAAQDDPYLQPNNSWISLSGTVVDAGASTFELDYGTGIVTVEMDDWDWYGEAYPILEGDKVTVYGYVDDDLYETTTIEAGSVYVRDLNTYFYANDADEEDAFLSSVSYVDRGIELRGTVTGISGREFTVDTGSRKMQVDTSEMIYNPLDDKGYQKIKVGDYVLVSGELDTGFFEDTEIMADSIITLVKDKTKRYGGS